MANTLPNVPPQASADQQNSVLNQVIDFINQQQRTQVIIDANGIPTIIIGVLPDGTSGIVIAKPGVNVLTLFT